MRGKLTKFGQLIYWGSSMSKIAKPWSGTVGGQGPAKSNRHTNKILGEAKRGVSGARVHVPPNLNQKHTPVPIHGGMRIMEQHQINMGQRIFQEAAELGKGDIQQGGVRNGILHGSGPSMAVMKDHPTAGTKGPAMGMRQRNPVSNMAREGGKPKMTNTNVAPGWMQRSRKNDKPNGCR